MSLWYGGAANNSNGRGHNRDTVRGHNWVRIRGYNRGTTPSWSLSHPEKKKPLINRSTQMHRAHGVPQSAAWFRQCPADDVPSQAIKIELTSVKTVHHFKSEDWFGEMVLPKRGFKWFQGISSQSIPSRPEAIYFRVTAWLDNFASVRGMLPLKATANTSWSLSHPEKKKPLINRSTQMHRAMGCLNLRLGFGGALQTTSHASIFLRGTIMPQNSGNFYKRGNHYSI